MAFASTFKFILSPYGSIQILGCAVNLNKLLELEIEKNNSHVHYIYSLNKHFTILQYVVNITTI